MSSDFTEHQSDDEVRKARKLSVEPTRPPATLEGYAIQNFIGRGSYGEVWMAIDQKTGKRVAIKFYAQRSSLDVKQLAQEVEKLVVLAADRHVVQLLDVGWDASPPYYVMDFIDSGSLEDLVKSGEALPVDRAVEVFKEIATGLMHLHGKGVLHCDLKPGNVLLDQDGNPRLADFGQSRLKSDNTSALGTLFYMAPEQADLKAVPDAKWDVYALGALLFTVLTGKPPYYSEELKHKIENAETLRDRLTIYRQSLANAKRPKNHRSIPGVDRTLADIIDRCIAARPSERFASAQSVLVALQQRDIKHQNRPLLLSSILGPLLLLLLMSAFGWWAVRQATNDANNAIIFKSGDSNQFAAKLAARSASEQLNEYFRVVQQVAKDDTFLKGFNNLLEDEELRQLRNQIADPNKNGTTETIRKRFVEAPVRTQLQSYLKGLLEDKNNEYPEAASWFATDRFGNQIAAAFEGGKSDTIGKNYSFRTYFTGFPEDVKDNEGPKRYPVQEVLSERSIIANPHLSASFLSQASGLQKVAFSSPVKDGDGNVLGIVAVTVNLGKLVDFDDSVNHYVMLVDDRKDANGNARGIILEHPAFLRAKLQNNEQRIPQELTEVKADIALLDKNETGVDPIGDTAFGKEHDYGRKFIVAVTQVGESSSEPQEVIPGAEVTGTDGIYVVAFEDYDSVIAPSRKLSARLGRLALLALFILMSVSIGMWFFVTRMFRENRRQFIGSPGSTSGNSLASLTSTSMSATATGQTAVTTSSDEKDKKTET